MENSHWLNKYVDCIVLLNLIHRTDRYDKSVLELSKVGINNVYHFPAVQKSNGIIGCTMSHYLIIKFAKQNKFKNILIFEDDIEFSCDKQQFQLILENCFKQILTNNILPSFLYLGGKPTDPPKNYFHQNKYYHKKIDSNLYELGGCKTTHAYIVFESVYDKIINTYDRLNWSTAEWDGDYRMGIDAWYLREIHHENHNKNLTYRNFIPYGVYPALADQRNDYSDIQNSICNYNLVNIWNDKLTNIK